MVACHPPSILLSLPLLVSLGAWHGAKPLKCQSNLKPKRVCSIRNRLRWRRRQAKQEKTHPWLCVCVCSRVYICICVNMCPTYFAKVNTASSCVLRILFPFPFPFFLFFFGSNTHFGTAFIQSKSKFVCLFINCITFILYFHSALGLWVVSTSRNCTMR